VTAFRENLKRIIREKENTRMTIIQTELGPSQIREALATMQVALRESTLFVEEVNGLRTTLQHLIDGVVDREDAVFIATRVSTDDVEIRAAEICVVSLGQLDPAARARTARYIADRFGGGVDL
jgi:hypothetical protein